MTAENPHDFSPVPNMRKSNGYVLLTGATGLVGQYLLKELLVAGVRVAVLARSNRRTNAIERIESIMDRWESHLGKHLPRPIVIEGDVAVTDLGISEKQRRWLQQNCKAVIHNAAVVSFEAADRSQDPWRTNLTGTENVVSFLKGLAVNELHYVSTAYVCGNRSGTILESELDCEQSFRNAYEESKFLAEKLIRDRCREISTTVYRPTIIAGDSQTGFTSSYHGLMWYLRLLDVLVPQQPRNEHGQLQTDIELPISGDEPQNIVTVDFVSRAIAGLFCNPVSHGRTYHLATDRPTTFRKVIDSCCKIFNSGGVKYCPSSKSTTIGSEFANVFFEQSKVYENYLQCETQFDMLNLRRFFPQLRSPWIDEQMIARFIEFGRHDRWGKRRIEVPELPDRVEERLRSWLSRFMAAKKSPSSNPLGIDLLGPGGHQWTARCFEPGKVVLEPGIGPDVKQTTRMTVQQLDCHETQKILLHQALAFEAPEPMDGTPLRQL